MHGEINVYKIFVGMPERKRRTRHRWADLKEMVWPRAETGGGLLWTLGILWFHKKRNVS